MNQIQQSSLRKWDCSTPPVVVDKCLTNIKTQEGRVAERRYDTNHAELSAAPKPLTLKDRAKVFKDKLLNVKAFNEQVKQTKEDLEKLNPISRGLRKAGVLLGRYGGCKVIGKLFTKAGKGLNKVTRAAGRIIDEGTLAVKRMLPTLNAVANGYIEGDQLYNEAAYNLFIDIPMTFAETGNNLKNLICDLIPFGDSLVGDKTLNKVEKWYVGVVNRFFKDHEKYQAEREKFIPLND